MNGLSPLLPVDNSPAYELCSPAYLVSSPAADSPAYHVSSPAADSPAYHVSSPADPDYRPLSPRTSSPSFSSSCSESSPRLPTLMEVAADQAEGCPGHPTTVFQLDLEDVNLDSLWYFITQQFPPRKWMENATRLMASLNDCNRPHLCKIILEWNARLPALLEDPTRPELEQALIIIDLCKFASEQWLSIPNKRQRRE